MARIVEETSGSVNLLKRTSAISLGNRDEIVACGESEVVKLERIGCEIVATPRVIALMREQLPRALHRAPISERALPELGAVRNRARSVRRSPA